MSTARTSGPTAPRLSTALVLAIGLCLRPTVAPAVSAGISGNSGKQGGTCADCHSGGVAPLVRLEGPLRVHAGALATFRFVLVSQSSRQQLAGFNVAASEGWLGALPGEAEHLEVGELTHDFPKPTSQNEASWRFTWRAPRVAGPQTIFAAGLSVNGTGTRSGDEAALLEHSVAVTDEPQPGDGNCDGSLSAGDLAAIAGLSGRGTVADCVLADADCDGSVGERDIDVTIAALFDSLSETQCSTE